MIEIKDRWTGEVIHSVEAETVKEAVEKLVNRGSNLIGANLSGANLRDANLRYADFRYADLSGANLSGANLSGANLIGANLRYADLSGAIKVPIYCKWTHGITDGNLIHIGCEKRTIEEWDLFFNSDETIETDRGTLEFKQIQAVYNAYKVYLQTINQ